MLQVRSYSFCGPHNLFAIHKNINLSALNDSNWMWPCTTQVYAFLALTAFDTPGTPEKILEIDFNPFCLIEYIHRNRLVVGPALLLDYYREKKGLVHTHLHFAKQRKQFVKKVVFLLYNFGPEHQIFNTFVLPLVLGIKLARKQTCFELFVQIQ